MVPRGCPGMNSASALDWSTLVYLLAGSEYTCGGDIGFRDRSLRLVHEHLFMSVQISAFWDSDLAFGSLSDLHRSDYLCLNHVGGREGEWVMKVIISRHCQILWPLACILNAIIHDIVSWSSSTCTDHVLCLPYVYWLRWSCIPLGCKTESLPFVRNYIVSIWRDPLACARLLILLKQPSEEPKSNFHDLARVMQSPWSQSSFDFIRFHDYTADCNWAQNLPDASIFIPSIGWNGRCKVYISSWTCEVFYTIWSDYSPVTGVWPHIESIYRTLFIRYLPIDWEYSNNLRMVRKSSDSWL